MHGQPHRSPTRANGNGRLRRLWRPEDRPERQVGPRRWPPNRTPNRRTGGSPWSAHRQRRPSMPRQAQLEHSLDPHRWLLGRPPGHRTGSRWCGPRPRRLPPTPRSTPAPSTHPRSCCPKHARSHRQAARRNGSPLRRSPRRRRAPPGHPLANPAGSKDCLARPRPPRCHRCARRVSATIPPKRA